MQIRIIPSDNDFEPVALKVATLISIKVSEYGADINYLSDDSTEKNFFIPVLMWNETEILF